MQRGIALHSENYLRIFKFLTMSYGAKVIGVHMCSYACTFIASDSVKKEAFTTFKDGKLH